MDRNLFGDVVTPAPEKVPLEVALARWVMRWVPRVQQEAAQRELDELMRIYKP